MNKMNINDINPYIRVAMRSTFKKGMILHRRVIFDYELIYLEDGEFTFHYAEKEYKLGAGQFIFIRPGIPHTFDCTAHDLSQPHVHFDLNYNSNSKITPVSFIDIPQMTDSERALIQKDEFADFQDSPTVCFTDARYASELLYRIIDVQKSNPLIAKGLLTELIALLIHDNFPRSLSPVRASSSHDITQQLKDYIDSTRGVAIELKRLERQFFYSKYHLERAFKKKYGVSLISYAVDKKMEYACFLLKSKSVSKVAEELGFSSIYSFSRAFKNKYGIAPTEYRSNAQK